MILQTGHCHLSSTEGKSEALRDYLRCSMSTGDVAESKFEQLFPEKHWVILKLDLELNKSGYESWNFLLIMWPWSNCSISLRLQFPPVYTTNIFSPINRLLSKKLHSERGHWELLSPGAWGWTWGWKRLIDTDSFTNVNYKIPKSIWL